jgi:hypothetical protein
MPTRNTLVRSLHDLGAAAWFGGSLMGALGVNGAAAEVRDPTDRARVAAAGWAKWAPASAAAIGAHLVGGAGLLLAHQDRVRDQAGVTANTTLKCILTGVALATTAYSGVLGAKVARGEGQPTRGGTEPALGTPTVVAQAQRQLRIVQWVTPVLTAAIIVLGAQQGEQQRPGRVLAGFGTKLARKARR